MFLLTVKLVKHSQIYARTFFTCLKNVQKHAGNFFNTKFQPQEKEFRSKANFRTFLPRDCSNVRLKQCEKL